MGYQVGAKIDTPLESGKSAEALYEEMRQLMDGGSKGEAIGGLKMLLAMYPDYALAHNDLGVLYYNQEEKEKALRHYEEAARLEPENANFQKNLADFYCVEMGELEEALKIYLKVLEANPTDIETLTILGDICVSLKKGQDARVFYERVLEIEPWNTEVQEKLEEIEKIQSSEIRDQRSANEEEQALDRPMNEGADDLAGSSAESELPEEAYERIQSLVNGGRQTEAIQELERLVERCPDYALGHNDLGVLYYNNGDKEKSLRHYEAAARLEPENATFQKNLEDFYCVEMGELEEALKIYLKVLEANPTDIETLTILGDICVSLKKGQDARVFYERVLELEPWNMDTHDKLEGLRE